MKKLWLAMVFVVVMACWGGSGRAEVNYNQYCDVCNHRFCYMGFMEGDGYHWKITTECGYKEKLPHNIECEDLTKCIDCGSTTNLGSAEITHIEAHEDYEDYLGLPCKDYTYTFDEYRHVLKCFCGEVTFEDDYHTPYSCYGVYIGGYGWNNPAETCQYCDLENARFLEERYQHSYFLIDDATGRWKCYCGALQPGVVRLPGDADNNSSVTLADARAILSGNVSSESNADVTGDGKVDTHDVLRIMQYLAGWGVTLQ